MEVRSGGMKGRKEEERERLQNNRQSVKKEKLSNVKK